MLLNCSCVHGFAGSCPVSLLFGVQISGMEQDEIVCVIENGFFISRGGGGL